MKAWMIREFGTPAEVVGWEDVEQETLLPGQVRVGFLMAPLNPADLNLIEGTYGTKPALPTVPGTEGVAEVLETCDERFAVGDRVICLAYAHSWQEQRVLAGDELFRVPAQVPLEELAMLKVNPATAWCLLHEFVDLPPGAVVVQNAANSAVGRCLIQIAKALGLQTVNFVRNVEERREELLASGADAVFADDESGFQEAQTWFLDREKPVLACNAVGGESAVRQLSLLAPGGVQVTYGAMGRRPVTVPNKFLIFQDLQIRGFWLTHWLSKASRERVEAVYGLLVKLLEKKQLQQVIDSVHDLEEWPAALRRLSAADRRGKVLLRCRAL